MYHGLHIFAIAHIKREDGDRHPFKEFEDAREASAIVGFRAAAALWP
jgi:hypothetical protein